MSSQTIIKSHLKSTRLSAYICPVITDKKTNTYTGNVHPYLQTGGQLRFAALGRWTDGHTDGQTLPSALSLYFMTTLYTTVIKGSILFKGLCLIQWLSIKETFT